MNATHGSRSPVADADPVGIAIELRRWATENALPLWSTAGFDRRRGGFQERLNPDGSPDLQAPRRLRVQARQIYVYAHAATLGWFSDAPRLMVEGTAFLVENYRAADGRPGYVFSLKPDNSVASNLRDTYDHMFVLLALAWAAKVSGDAQIRAELDRALAFVDEHLTARDGSLVEGIPASQPRRQNPHMHALEAMLAMHETLAHPQALRRADALLTMMNEKLFDARTQTVGEYFTADWKPLPGPAGDCVEPGHQAEWAWLLRKNERLRGLPAGPLASTLLQSALRWADAATGLLIDEADRNGPPRQTSRRAWPQTELAKAWLAEAEAGRAGAAGSAAVALQRLRDHHLDKPCVGGWTDRFDQGGRPLTEQMAATTLYHVFGAIAEADRVLNAST
jgi:mannose/cellobiose epimerase-like protein (N-acyl-D-glucosamine 2-epimerase family)